MAKTDPLSNDTPAEGSQGQSGTARDGKGQRLAIAGYFIALMVIYIVLMSMFANLIAFIIFTSLGAAAYWHCDKLANWLRKRQSR